MNNAPAQSSAPSAEQRLLMVAVVISLVGHIALFGVSHLLTRSSFKSVKLPQSIDIDLVQTELPATKKPKKSQRTQKTSAPVKKPSSSAPKKTSSKTPPVKKSSGKSKALTSKGGSKYKRRVVTPEDLVQDALSQIQKQQAAKPQPKDTLSDRIQRMRQEVKESEATRQAGPSDGVTSKGKRTAAQITAEERYYRTIEVVIRSNWAFPARPDGEEILQAQVGFTILSDGTIKDHWMAERSGNGNYDRSAVSAVLKSSPLPPFPAAVNKRSMPVVIIFNEKDLQP